MPAGFQGVRDVSADIEARKQSGGGSRLWFRLPNNNDKATVRFLEQDEDVSWAWMHELPATGNKSFGDKVPCRDQDETGARNGEPCPGCEQDYPRRFQGQINLIWRDAPVLKRDSNGRLEKDANGNVQVAGHKDQIAVWTAGITVFEELDGKNATYKGLTTRDFVVTRKGTGLSTRYSIEPADPDAGATPLSKADQELETEKYDLTPDTTPPSYQSWGKQSVSQAKTSEDIKPAERSPFMRARD